MLLWPSGRCAPFSSPRVDSCGGRQFPALQRARGLETTLAPGEVLWLPSFYWHYVRQCDVGEPNLSVRARLSAVRVRGRGVCACVCVCACVLVVMAAQCLPSGVPQLNCWCGARADGSTILGGRARGYKNAQESANAAGSDHLGDARVEALIGCSSGCAAVAAADAAARSSAAKARREVKDEALLASALGSSSGGGGDSNSGNGEAVALWAEEVDFAAGLHTLFTGRWLETEAAARLRAEGLDCTAAEVARAQLKRTRLHATCAHTRTRFMHAHARPPARPPPAPTHTRTPPELGGCTMGRRHLDYAWPVPARSCERACRRMQARVCACRHVRV